MGTGRKEGNVLFNNALNTFYLRLYGFIWLCGLSHGMAFCHQRWLAAACFLCMSDFAWRSKPYFPAFTMLGRFFTLCEHWIGIKHMVKNHDRERKPAATTSATLSDEQQGFFYMHHSTDRITQPLYTRRGALAGMSNRTMKNRSDDPSYHERTLLPRSYISLWDEEGGQCTK